MRLPVLLAACVLTGACGDDTSQPAAATPTATATAPAATAATNEPIGERLSALCEDVNDAGENFDQRTDELASAEKYDELAAYLRESLQTAEPFDEKVEALDPPPDERAAFRRYVEANQRLRRLLADLADAVERRAFGEVQEISRTAEQVSQVRLEAALDLGADECGS